MSISGTSDMKYEISKRKGKALDVVDNNEPTFPNPLSDNGFGGKMQK